MLSDNGLREFEVDDDGNCQFRAIAHQLYGDQKDHRKIRDIVVSQLKRQRHQYEGFVEGEYDNYVDEISKNREWGNHLTLQAFADAEKCQIVILTTYDPPVIWITPNHQNGEHDTNTMIQLSFWVEQHYGGCE